MTNFTTHNAITIGERTRELNLEHRDELVKDIMKNGLLQPIVLGDREDSPLVDGLHRLEALRALYQMGEVVFYDGEPLGFDSIPFVRFSDLDESRLLEAEIAANLFRKELTWQERTDALARLHRMQKGLDPSATFESTAAKLAGVTGQKKDTIQRAISRATVISDAMAADPELAKARSETEAFSRVKSDITRLSTALLADGFSATSSLHTLIAGKLEDEMPKLIGRDFSLILADPPYGVGADTWTSKFEDAPHDYDDTLENAIRVAQYICHHGISVTAGRANLFMFCAIEHWHTMRGIADRAGWSVWPHPVIWHKSNEGIRPWGQKGYAYCYEAILFAAKGKDSGLLRTGPDVISNIYKVRDREHGAAKPPALYRLLIEQSCLPGDHVLDPCCGSGTIFEAATLSNTIATGIEINSHFVGLAQQRMALPKPDLIEEDFLAL